MKPEDRIWRIKLSGERLDLTALLQALDGADIELRKEDDFHFLTSDRFEGLSEPREVHATAMDVVAELNGAALLQWDNAEPVKVAGISKRKNEPGKWTTYGLTEPIRMRARFHGVSMAVVSDGRPKWAPRPRLQQIVAAAEVDDDVQEVLQHLGAELTWYGLYKVYEIIGRASGFANLSASKSQRTRFCRSAQMRRHSQRQFQQPSDPMSLEEAAQFIGRMVNEWLEDQVPQDKEPEA